MIWGKKGFCLACHFNAKFLCCDCSELQSTESKYSFLLLLEIMVKLIVNYVLANGYWFDFLMLPD